jgi:hypothetical protein
MLCSSLFLACMHACLSSRRHNAGLCCGALLAKYGYSVSVCEAHYHAGGAAHAFEAGGYRFDSGPSFFAGLSGACCARSPACWSSCMQVDTKAHVAGQARRAARPTP